MGSDPAESTKMSGVTALESLKDGSIAKGMGSTKRMPMELLMKEVIAGTSCAQGWSERGGEKGGEKGTVSDQVGWGG